jgi:hypothetical protein
MKHLKIMHPYGRIGGLPWDAAPGEPVLEFGRDGIQGPTLNRVAKGIRTFAERVEEGDELGRIRTAVREANQLIFLGFSYLDQNMDLLRPNAPCRAGTVFGTTFGESDSNSKLAVALIRKMLKGSEPGPGGHPPDSYVTGPTLVGASATDFIKAYGNSIRR